MDGVRREGQRDRAKGEVRIGNGQRERIGKGAGSGLMLQMGNATYG